jgi:hypothetical protein
LNKQVVWLKHPQSSEKSGGSVFEYWHGVRFENYNIQQNPKQGVMCGCGEDIQCDRADHLVSLAKRKSTKW